jgi:transcriptional regulator with XRE-family HTH domain
MDDIRAGRLLRALRKRARLTQAGLGARVGISQQEISLLERGHLEAVQVRTIRAVFGGLEARLDLDIRWRGGAVDRLLDERHAALAGNFARFLAGRRWEVVPEVTYSEFGERGSIDLLAWHAVSATVLIVEIKTELTSIEATVRKHDEKVRLASGVVTKRFGWEPRSMSRVLVLPDHRTARRQVDRTDAILSRAYPCRGWALRRWLANPSEAAVDGLLFLPFTARRGGSQPPRA